MITAPHITGLIQQFQHSEQFYYVQTDLEGRISYANQLFRKHFGPVESMASAFINDADKFQLTVRQCIGKPGRPCKLSIQSFSVEGEPNLLQWEISVYDSDGGDGKAVHAIGFAENPFSQSRAESLPEKYIAYENSTEGLWRFDLKEPISSKASPDEIIAHFRKYAWVAECNDNLARMYGFEKSDELLGATMDDLMDMEDQAKLENIRNFIRNGFCSSNVETKEFDREGRVLYFMNSMTGIVEDGMLKRVWGTQHDITDQRIAEQELEKSDSFYRNLITNSLDGIILTDFLGQITYCGPSVKKLVGYDAEELVGKNVFEFVHQQELQIAKEAFKQELHKQTEVSYVLLRLKHKDGTWNWYSVRGHNLLNDPSFNSMVIYFADDTMRKSIEDKLRESERSFRSLIQNMNQGVVVMDANTAVLLCNPAALKMLGLKEQQLLGRTNLDNWDIIYENGEPVPPENLPSALCLRTRRPVRDAVVGVFRPETNDRVWLLANADLVMDSNNEIVTAICCFTDITEQKRTSQQLLENEVSKQRFITQAQIDGQEKERLEIGKELHDNISQHLTTTRLYLEVALEKANGELKEMINLAHTGISDIISEIRHLSQALIPPTLGDLGLKESVQDLCDAIKRAHTLNIEFNCKHFDEKFLPENLKLMLFRIIQEQLNNIMRHAHASRIYIKLQMDAEYITAIIVDDGIGFDLNAFRRGLGFNNIVNRAALFNGKVDFETSPGAGCTLTVSIPGWGF